MMKLNKSKSTDGNGLTKHFSGLKKADNSLTVGVQQDAHDYPDGTSVLMVAMVGEFGNASNNIVPRHFLSRAVEVDERFYKSRITFILKKYDKDPKLVNIMMGELGRQSSEKVRKHIEANDIGMAPNKASTANAKGGNQPLVDSGHLARQIDYKTERGRA